MLEHFLQKMTLKWF